MSTTNYVCYRLPEQKEYVRLEQREGEPVAMKSVKDLNGRKGFVFAPVPTVGRDTRLALATRQHRTESCGGRGFQA